MNRSLGFLVVLLLLATPAAAQKVAVDYDRQADFRSYKTFSWTDTAETSVGDGAAQIDSMIKNAVEYWLTDGGMIEVDEDPDLYVTYHTNAKQQMQLNTASFGYRQGGDWFYAGAPTTTTTSTHTQGTLVIDAWDAKKKTLVWRGTATAAVPDDPSKGGKKVDAAVKKIVRKWRKLYQSEQK